LSLPLPSTPYSSTMHISTLFVSTALSLAVPVVSAASNGRELARRQVSVGSPSPLPSQCTSTCSPVNNEINLGCPVTACCTTTFESQYYNCLACVGTALHVANFSTYQNSLNLLYTTCVDVGFVLPRMELPGQSNATGSASVTATGSSGSSATGAAVGSTWHIVQAQVWVGAAVLLALAALW
jgi:hypothetical protein